MFPHESQALMAKIVFVIFATIMLCLMQIRAESAGQSLKLSTLVHTNILN